MKHITKEELQRWSENEKAFELIDVREAAEHEAFNIGGRLIPLSDIMGAASEIPTDVPVVVYCKRGIRSQIAIQRLQQRHGFENLYNLQGGVF